MKIYDLIINDFYKFQRNLNNVVTKKKLKTKEKPPNVINRTEGKCTKTNQKQTKRYHKIKGKKY